MPATWPHAPDDMAVRIREFDWAVTPLGPLPGWSQSLRTTVDLVLAAPFASVLLWGPEFIVAAYNAGYRTILNTKPEALGQPVLEVWTEERALLAPQLARVLNGESLSFKELPMRLRRGLASDEAWFDYGYGPVRDETGRIAGILVTISEITHLIDRVHEARDAEARQEFQLELGDALGPLQDAARIKAEAMRVLGEHLGAVGAQYWEAEPDGEGFVADGSFANGVAACPARVRRTDFGPTAREALTAGRTFAMADAASDPRIGDAERATFDEIGLCASIGVPLVKEGRLVAVLGLYRATAHDWTDNEIAAARSTAERTWAAVERARAEEALRESQARYSTLFKAISSGFCVIEMIFDGGRAVDYRFVEANPAFERQSGLIDAVGRRIREFTSDLEEHWFERYGRVALTGEPMRVEGKVEPLGRWFDINAFRVGAPEQRRVAVLFTDISARRDAEAGLRRSEERQAFLLKLSDALRPIADPVEIQDVAMRVLGQQLGAVRARYWETEPDGQHIASAGSYPDGTMRAPSRVRMADFGVHIQEALAAGRALAVADAATDPRVGTAELAAYDASGFRAYIGVPLVKEGRLVAALGVYRAAAHRWTNEEIDLAQETAERTWAAVERSKAETALRESEDRFRQFGDNSPDTFWIIDVATSRLVYLSLAYERIWGEPRERVVDDLDHWREHVHPDDRALVAEGIPSLLAGRRHSIEYRIVRPDGQIRWIFDAGFPIVDESGRVTRVAGVAQDLTARREAEDRVRASEQRFRLLLEGIPQLVWRAVDHGRWSWASPQWTTFTGQFARDSHGWGWLDMVHPDDREAARAAWRRSNVTDRFAVEYRLRMAADGRYRWFSTRAMPVRDEAGALIEWLGTSTDIDDLRRLQGHQQVLLGELQHRVRNGLAVVRSIARRTAETSETVEQFSLHLEGRLGAFARTQAAVTRDPTGGIDLRTIAVDELLAHVAWEGEHTLIDGPEIRLRAKAGETLALAFHELTSNAVKYGALSVPQGIIRLSWHVDPGSDGAEQLVIVWDETRPGKPLRPPRRRGFGTELLESTLHYELEADTLLDFRSSGLHCVIIIPLTDEVGWKG